MSGRRMKDMLLAAPEGEAGPDTSLLTDDSGRLWLGDTLATLPVALLEAK
jgi:hypothetical protein